MSRVVERRRRGAGGAAGRGLQSRCCSSLTRRADRSRLSSRRLTVQHGAPRLRHPAGDRRGRSSGHPPISARAGRRRARRRRRPDRLRPFRLLFSAVGAFPARHGGRIDPALDARAAHVGPELERGPVALAISAAAVSPSALCCSPARWRAGHYAWWPGIIGGVLCAGVGILATRPLLARVRTRLDSEAAGALPVFTEAVALAGAVLSVLAPPVGIVVLALPAVAAARRARTRRAEVRRPANPAVGETPVSEPKKLVLAVIDAMKPSMLERAIASGRAPALAQVQERGVYVGDCVAAFPSVTPVCAATITTGVGPDEHLIPSMNWYHREEGRYIEYGSSFSASRQFGVLRSLTDTVYRMNAEHLSRGGGDGVRDARRCRRAHRRHHLPDLPRPPRARGRPGVRTRPDRHLDAVSPHDPRPPGAVLRRPVRLAQDRLPWPARAARRP